MQPNHKKILGGARPEFCHFQTPCPHFFVANNFPEHFDAFFTKKIPLPHRRSTLKAMRKEASHGAAYSPTQKQKGQGENRENVASDLCARWVPLPAPLAALGAILPRRRILPFIAYFCMLLSVDNNLECNQAPEIWITDDENHLSIGELKYRYLQTAKQNFQGKIFTNKGTGKPIKVSKDGIMEWWRKSRRREHIVSVRLLDFFLENANLIDESPDYLGRAKIASASRLESLCKINGKPYAVLITTRKAVFDIDKFRYFALKAI